MKERIQQKPAKKISGKAPFTSRGKADGGYVILAEGEMGGRAEISAHLIAARRKEALPPRCGRAPGGPGF